MEALFDAPSSSHPCASLADLQQQLRHHLDTKTTPSKAEHVSVTLELRSPVSFAVPVTEAENASLEAGAGIDPRLGGARAGSTVMGHDGQALRHINALDTVLNQSQDDPVVQRIVAKHIMTGVGEADQSHWIMRSMTRGTQGWTFTYGCKDSAQSWARRNAKNPARTVVGEWSGGQDPINLSRPAFDCRGTLTIAFSKSEKAISVKYEHTNMHKTVGELLDLLAPPPPQPQAVRSTEGRKSISKRTPKGKRQPGEGAENGVETGEEGVTPRPKKRKKPTQDGEGSSQKRARKKKNNNENDSQIDPALGMLPPGMPGARPVGDSTSRPFYNTQAQQNGSANGNSSTYPDALVGNQGLNGTEAEASAMISSSMHAHSILNLPAGEADRRREVAIRLLAKQGIDPKTLSPEQFSIFAHQSPALQKESLGMLVKYGAERLRIVLPDKNANESQASTAPTQGQSADTTPTADEQPNKAETPKKKRRSRKNKSDAADTSIADDTTPLTKTSAGNRQKKTRAPRLSRGACIPCRGLKVKCDKGKPSCEKCLESGTACTYPIQQSRKSKAAEEEAEDSADPADGEQPADTDNAPTHEDDEPDGLPSPGFSYEDPGAPPHQDSINEQETEQEPDPAAESVPMQDNPQSAYGEPNNGIYHHASGLTFPQSISPEVTQQMWTSGAGTGTNYNQASVHASNNVGLTLPLQTQESSTSLSYPEQTVTANASASNTGTHQQHKSWGSYTSSQRSGVADVPSATTSVGANLDSHANTSWGSYSNPDAASAKNASTSPRQSRRTTKQNNNSSHNPQHVDGMRTVSALAQAAINSAANPASPVQNTPYEAAAPTSRAKSRQSMRPQTRTPVPSYAGSRQPQRSAPSAAANTGYSTGPDKTAPTNYNNSYSQYSTTADASSNGVSYQPYSQQSTTSATASLYPNYGSYNSNTRSHGNNNTVTQQVASSYPSTTPSTTAQWGETTSSQSRDGLPYTSTPSTSASPSLNLRSSNSQRAQIPPSFNVRPQAPSHPQSRPASTATYPQQNQHGLPSYSSYSSQPQQSTTSNQQQNWYGTSTTSGYGSGGSRSSGATGTGFSASSGGASGTSAAGGHYGQQAHQPHAHHAMNLSGHTYSSLNNEGEPGLYNMLPGNSGH